MPAKFGAKHDVHGQVINTVACTVKIKIPDTLAHRLNGLLPVVFASVARMLRNRNESSSRYYPELPCEGQPSIFSRVPPSRSRRIPQVRKVSAGQGWDSFSSYFGCWPGDETDDEWKEMMLELKK